MRLVLRWYARVMAGGDASGVGVHAELALICLQKRDQLAGVHIALLQTRGPAPQAVAEDTLWDEDLHQACPLQALCLPRWRTAATTVDAATQYRELLTGQYPYDPARSCLSDRKSKGMTTRKQPRGLASTTRGFLLTRRNDVCRLICSRSCHSEAAGAQTRMHVHSACHSRVALLYRVITLVNRSMKQR
jgi:hypothetical protein